MGKRKDVFTEDNSIAGSTLSPSKKNRKNKHSKMKPIVEDNSDDVDVDTIDDVDVDDKPSLKLKIKLEENLQSDKTDSNLDIMESLTEEDKKKLKKQTASDAEDEEAWLEALETGKLDEFDEIKRMKDPALMTARQKALFEGKGQKSLYFPEPETKAKEMTEEMIEKKAQIAKRRRQQVQAKREKDKKQTLDRLLKKQEAKVKADGARMARRKQSPNISFSYINNSDGIFVSTPLGYDFPLSPSKPLNIIEAVKCGVKGCENVKKYNCSKTNVPLCSLKCYKKNLKISVT